MCRYLVSFALAYAPAYGDEPGALMRCDSLATLTCDVRVSCPLTSSNMDKTPIGDSEPFKLWACLAL